MSLIEGVTYAILMMFVKWINLPDESCISLMENAV